jgi:hypothetical protein
LSGKLRPFYYNVNSAGPPGGIGQGNFLTAFDDRLVFEAGPAYIEFDPVTGRVLRRYDGLGGASRHVRRTEPRLCVLLAKDPVLPLVQEVKPREAARVLASGQLPGLGGKTFAFVNPHLVGLEGSRADLLRVQHERLFASTKVVMLNMAIGSVEAAAGRLVELVR